MFQLATRRAIGVSLLLTASIVFQTVPMIGTAAAFARNRKDASPKRQPQPSSESVARQPLVASNGSLPLPAAPNITATKVDAWDDTATPDGKAEPGQTITYSVTISNTGSADATGVTFTDSVDANTTLVPGSITTQPIAAPDSYNVIGNVRIQVPDGASDLLANDCDPDPAGGPCTNTGLTVTTLAGDSTAPFAGLSTAGGNVTATTGDGSFQYNPAPGFAGQDTFTYTVTDGTGKTDTATVTLQVGNGTSTPGTNVIWFVDPAAAPGGDGRLTSPFNCYTGGTASCFSQTAADDPGDAIFLFAGSITGGYALLANQKLVGAGASDTLANIAGLTVPTASDALPTTNGTPSGVTITTTNVNAIPLPAGAGNTPLLRGFTVGNVGTGTKISGNTFGTLTVGNNTTPDVTLNGTGQALNLNTGTLAATSAFTGVTTTSSSTSGLNLTAVSGTLALGSTTVSGNNNECMVISNSAANLSFGNTSCTGGGNGVSISGAAGGTRTFGTLSVSGGTGNAYTQSGGGGNVTVNGAATLSSGAPDTIVIQNANGNTINFAGGATVNHTGTGGNGIQWSGTNSGSTLTFATLALTTSDGTGMNLSGGGTVNVTTAAGSSISATGVGAQTAPAILANGIALNANLTTTSCNGSGTGGNCVNLTTVTGTSNLGGGTLTGAAGATFLVSGGTASVTYGGGITQGNNAAMVSVAGGHNGTLTFNTGTLSATNGTGLQFDNADGTYNFNGTNTLNGGDAGIDILNGSSGTFTFSASSTITSPSGTAFNVASSPGNPNVTYSGSITDNTAGQRTVNIDGTTGGSISIATVTAASTAGGVSNTGVNINNANGNVTFTTLSLGTSGTRQTAQALTITNGGSGATYSLGAVSIFTNGASGLVATNADGTITIASGTVDATSGTAINIDGPAGLTTLTVSLTKVSSTNASRGIDLQDSNGSFAVTGTGGTCTSANQSGCSGGTISGMTGADDSSSNPVGTGINLNNVVSISLTRMFIHDHSNYGIRGTSVTGFTLDNSVLNGTNGTDAPASASSPFNEGSIKIDNLAGSATISNTFISGGISNNVRIDNTSATVNRVTFTNDTIGANSTANGEDGIQLQSESTGRILATIQNTTFTSARGDLFNFLDNAASGSADDLIFNNNILSNNHPAIATGGGGVTISSNGTKDFTFHMESNTMRDAVGHAVLLVKSTGTASYSGTFTGNTIGVAATNNSGSKEGSGLKVQSAGQGTLTIAITNNQIHQYNNNGIELLTGGGATPQSGTFNAIITGNTIDTPGNNAATNAIPKNGIHLNGGTVPGDTFAICTQIGGAGALQNSIATSGKDAVPPTGAGDLDFRLRQRQATTVRLPGYGGANNDNTAVQNFVIANNSGNGAPVGQAQNTVPTGGGFVGGASCTAPTTAPTTANSTKDSLSSDSLWSESVKKADQAGVERGESSSYATKGESPDAQAVLKLTESEALAMVHAATFLGSVNAYSKLSPNSSTARENGTDVISLASKSEVQRRGLGNVEPGARITSQEPSIRKAEVRHQTSDIRSQRSDVRLNHARTSKLAPRKSKLQRAEVGSQEPGIRAHHAKTTRALKPVLGAGGTVTVNIGTLAPGDSVTITFQVTIDNPYSGGPNVSNQGTVSGSNFSNVLTDDPAVGGAADPTLTPINVAPDVSISNAKVAEPTSGTTPMLFTVALSAPAAGTITVTYNTADGSAVAPGDYVSAVNQTVTFAAGEQLKIIPITVNSDVDGSEGDENFTVTISVPPGQGNVVGATGTGTITAANPAGTLLISELRTSGPGGSADEFVEIYNNTDTPHVVAATNGSTGYGVFKMGASCNATPILVGTIPNGTTIPARGHYLLVGSAYSLADYGGTGAAAGNLTMTSDIENDRNVSIFSTTNILALSTTTRFDAVGFGTNTGNVCDLQREGTNLGNLLGSTLQYSFFRTMTKTSNGNPKDTNDNAADFLFADTTGTLVAGAGQHLGAPGPENLASPIRRDTSGILLPLLDSSVSSASAPNRFRDLTPAPPTASQGTMEVRRRVQNTTGATVTRLRFRIVDITTFPSPGAGTADLRVLTSSAVTISGINDPATCASTGTPATVPCQVTAQVTTLETPPAQANGGGYNSTVTVTLPGPGLANNASIDVNFKLGVVTTGNFRFLIIVEALP